MSAACSLQVATPQMDVTDLLTCPPPRTRIDACPFLMKNYRDTKFAFDSPSSLILWQSTPPPLTFLSISNQPPQSQPVMAQQDDGWPLGLRLLNARVGLLENRNFPGSISFNTLPTGSPISFTDSSDLDSESSGSFFHAKSITLGSLIGDSTSSIMELSRRGNTEANLGGDRKINNFRFKYKPWLFSLCCKLSTDVVSATRTHSLAHFLEVERRRTAAIAAARPLPIAGRANNLLTS
ncbi:unnamed protein product [Citrullus colocynthis]|uniref:Uncharacterized protein n=1 Tax=Citrullus colocynthis TaxID=252529 RepID=A0ABP0YHK7_9ROSI